MMGRAILKSACGSCDEPAAKTSEYNSDKTVKPNENYSTKCDSLTAPSKEKYSANGFVYERCRYCGSILVRRTNVDVCASPADVAAKNAAVNNETGVVGPESETSLEPELDRLPGNVSEGLCAAADGHVSSNEGGTEAGQRAETAFFAGQSALYGLSETCIIDEDERRRSARAYGLKVSERGCGGICIQYDAQMCDGLNCKACEVMAAKLCCKRHLVGNRNANVLERDGGDYRNLMGNFARRLSVESGYDAGIRRKLNAEAVKIDTYRDEVHRQVIGTNDENLIFEWRDYSLNDLLVMFPHVDRRPVRVEIQLLIYLCHNYRYPIDIGHAETRFQIPRLVINRYLRSYFGYSYTSLLAKIRNEHSKTLLHIPLLRIGEIGILVGYKSHYHYSLNFKRYEGISPKEYRNFALDNAPLI